jgi:hypothetical protein
LEYFIFSSTHPRGPDRSDDSFIQTLKHAIQWDTLNAPRKFGLTYREMKVRIGIDAEGNPSSRITLL